ncbi:heteromeric transposase endonuclease subunit TnsA [Dechloromonas sp. XY25]|uniref:Heteromeric transposase endonuclease subunit TnsA n=1 Tax=Dechloromonas hankyongensis TaxID=2908002 RepID=A0ABS9JY84_9RHOO|nr:TnsA endonuclease N-terminal domain-containing protein [Dechloromonas hankyongensis]MCG2575866.1 heteromeric transposase endonuclease subunit TnsA [Dechloromonas hankyongensis]
MAVRKIGINCRSITGRHGHSGQPFESALERDFLDLIAFDLNVERHETQPVNVYYPGCRGEMVPYRPDVLVIYRRDVLPARDMPHLLAEIKYRDEYRGRFHELRERFCAARRFAKERGWQFRVFTEREIRTPYLGNARFLRPYREVDSTVAHEAMILDRLKLLGQTTPANLMALHLDNALERAKLLPVLWKLIANFRVGADLMQKFDMCSPIWPLPNP